MLVFLKKNPSIVINKMHGKMLYWDVKKQNRESTEGYSKSIVRKHNDKFGKGLVSTSRTYASPKWTGPGVRRNKRPLSACHTRRKCSMETTQNSVKGRVRYKVWSVGGCHCIWSGHRMSFNICGRETSYCLIRRKRRRFDPVLWQNPLYQQKIRKPKDTHKHHQKFRLHNDCGPT